MLLCAFRSGFNSSGMHFFSGPYNIIKTLQIMLTNGLNYCFYCYYVFQHLESMELDGIHLESMECLWNIPCGFHVDIPYGFHGFQVDIPYGFHGFQVDIPYGFHGFQVDSTYSMWNMHGIKTPIWVRFHPKHIPYGMDGIHLE
jgi:hypothetical protein